jgi:cytochrome c oxidase cbb3-type subunit 3
MKRLDRNRGRMGMFFSALISSAVSLYADNGPALFEQQCAACHGADGKARTPAGRKIGAKDLTQSRLSDGEIERQVSEGTTDKAGKVKMPPFKDQLSSSEIQALVSFVKSFREGRK